MVVHEDIMANIAVTDELMRVIEKEYMASLKQQQIDPKLAVRIKNYLENLRAPLDYVSKHICSSLLGQKRSHLTYFPISCANEVAFQKHMNKNMPGLESYDQTLYQVFCEFQPYQPTGCKALPRLSKLVNENKHNRLSPQTRSEQRGLRVDFPGGSSIQMSPGSSISGSGSISSGGGIINLAGGSISGDSPARLAKNVQQTVILWVSFHFSDTDEEVLGLLKNCREDVIHIVETLRPILWP